MSGKSTESVPAGPGRPTVSIGMPVSNAVRTVHTALDGLLAQTYTDFELIISDDASVDGTDAICREYARRDGRVRYYRNREPVGAQRNHNLVLSHARGPIFKWTSAWDVCAPGLLASCTHVLARDRQVVLCYPRTRLFFADGEVADYDDNLDLDNPDPVVRCRRLLQNMRLNNAIYGLVRTDALRAVQPLGGYRGADVNLMIELALRGRFKEVPQPLFFRNGDSSTRRHRPGDAAPGAFDGWQYYGQRFLAVHRGSPGMVGTCRLYGHLLRHVLWKRHELITETVSSATAGAERQCVPRGTDTELRDSR